jgi:hypothetical protein
MLGEAGRVRQAGFLSLQKNDRNVFALGVGLSRKGAMGCFCLAVHKVVHDGTGVVGHSVVDVPFALAGGRVRAKNGCVGANQIHRHAQT